jgi:23S rRNA pseudouridine1911/1915/1917 synthase
MITERQIRLQGIIPPELAGHRVDQALATMFNEHSRARITDWIRRGEVHIDQQTVRPRDKVRGGEQVLIDARCEAHANLLPEPIPLDVMQADDDILVINKPPGLVVHPGAGNPDHTLLNALLAYDPALAHLPRAGIVQRLDKDTSGLMVIARTLPAHTRLVAALQAREVKREYLAVVNGVLTAGGRIEAPIGRHPRQRIRMAVVTSGKPAVTHYRVVQRYRAHTLVRLQLESGRTHQIRVHMAHLRHSVLGDPLYGGRPRLPQGATESLRQQIQGFRRQALHACALGLLHPRTAIPLEFEAPLPEDMRILIQALADDARRE